LQRSCNKVVVKQISGCVCTACSQLLWQVWNKLSSLCYKINDGNRLATSFSNLFQTCQQLGTSAANISCWQVGRFLSVHATFWHTFWHMPFTLQTALYVINFSSFTSELVVNTTDMLPLSKPHSCAFLDMNGDYTAGIYTIFITKIILTVHVP
jgi:hypothetical protein